MEKKNRSKWPVAVGVILTVSSILAALILYAEYKPVLSAVFAILALLFIWIVCTENPRKKADKAPRKAEENEKTPKETDSASEKAGKASKANLKAGKGSDKLINKILEGININCFLSDPAYQSSGVKIMAINTNRTIKLILTEDCVYEGVSASYQSPEKGAEKISFQRGEEDEEISGYCRFRLDANGKGDDLYLIVLRKDLVEKYGDLFFDCPMTEGVFYNSYKVNRIYGFDRCAELAEQVTALLRRSAKK